MLPKRSFFDQLADAAKAQTLPLFRSRLDVVNKLASGFDPVTEGDRNAEAAIRDLIVQAFPDHGILGEELGNMGMERDLIWVIDPIDGTRAFISGVPVWGTLIGLYHQGRAIMGMIDQPFTGERYFADESGSYYRGPDGERQLQTRACSCLSDAVLFTTSPHVFDGHTIERYRTIESRVRLFRYGIDCYAYALLAAGHVDLVIEDNLKPYDVGGIIPVIERAGGIITTWTGERPENGGTIIAAGNRALYDEAMAILNV